MHTAFFVDGGSGSINYTRIHTQLCCVSAPHVACIGKRSPSKTNGGVGIKLKEALLFHTREVNFIPLGFSPFNVFIPKQGLRDL